MPAWKKPLAWMTILAAAATGGCVARAHGSAYVEERVVFHEPPPLVEIESGVWVVRDYHEPAYYVEGHYWYYVGGVWYRAASWNAPRVRVSVDVVPRLVVHRHHRHYVRFSGPPHARVATEAEVRAHGRAHAHPKRERGAVDRFHREAHQPPGFYERRNEPRPPGHKRDKKNKRRGPHR